MDGLTAARAAWARADFAPVRAALGRVAALGPWARARAAEGVRLGDAALVVEGRLWVEPMGGAVFDGGRLLDPGWERAAPVDWIVRAFPARQRIAAVAPLAYGRRPGAMTFWSEVLPRLAALRRLGVGDEVVALVSRDVGRLKSVQATLGAGALAPRPVKVHAWDKLIGAERVVLLRPDAARAEDAEAAGAWLRAAFGAEAGGPLRLCLAAEGPVRGGLAVDAAPLASVVRRAAGAERLEATTGAAAALAVLRGARTGT